VAYCANHIGEASKVTFYVLENTKKIAYLCWAARRFVFTDELRGILEAIEFESVTDHV
jgi:hypothetical protein